MGTIRVGLVVGAMVAMSSAHARADVAPFTYEQLLDRATELGNHLTGGLEVATRDRVVIRVDGRAQSAHLRLYAGDHHFSLYVESDVRFADGMARISSPRIGMAIAGRELSVRMPDVEVWPASYNGEHFTQWLVPVYERRW